MITRLWSRAAPVVALAGGCVIALGLGWLAPQQPLFALAGAGAALFLGFLALDAALVPLVLLPLLYVVLRVGGGGVDLSVSDLALGVGAMCAIVFTQRPLSPPMRTLIWFTVVYQVTTLFTVIANPYLANVVEWVHAWFLVGGALFLGWAVGRGRYGPTGLKLMLATAAGLAGLVILTGLGQIAGGNFAPVYLDYGMHKNFLGTVLGTTALIAYVRPAWLALHPLVATVLFWWLAAAVGFTQSRQAIIGLAVAIIVLVLRSNTDRRRSKVVLLAAVPVLYVVYTLVRDQIASGNEHNSFFTRLSWYEDALAIWTQRPVTGVGLRWWYTDRFQPSFQPPNAEIEVLTSAGLIGLAGFLVLMIGSLIVLWRLEPAYGMLAAVVVLSRFVQGQFDIFWVASQTSIPFAIAGICLGVHALRGAEERTAVEAGAGNTPMGAGRS